MSVHWAHYRPYTPPFSGPLAGLTRAEARQSFEQWCQARAERWHELQVLVGDELTVSGQDDDIQALNNWFRAHVARDPQDSSRLQNRWYAVVNDIAVVLGDTLVERCPGLRWEFFTRAGRRDVAYQKHVITGFSRVSNPRYNCDVDRLVATYAYQIVAGDVVASDYFLQVLRAGQECA